MVKKCTYKFLIIILLMMIISYASAQKSGQAGKYLENAKKYFVEREWDKAVEWAEKSLKSAPNSLEVILLLADIYKETDRPEKEISCLQKALQQEGAPSLVHYRLSEAYFSLGRYEESLAVIEDYLDKNPAAALVAKAERIRANAQFSIKAVKNPVRYDPQRLSENVNSQYSEYWPSLTIDGNTLIFTRLVPVGNGRSFLQEDFFMSRFQDGGWLKALPVAELNSELNEGAQTLSADGKLIFFTLCNHPDGEGSCDIWFSHFTDGKWSAPRNAGAPLNTQYWEGQPSLSSFGDILYFSSNRPGGRGNKDLWSIVLKGWNAAGYPLWGEPVNLGDSINTPGDEISPFIHSNGNDLFFGSDYWPGLGGFDLFRSRRNPDGIWSKAENLGYPVNTSGNEQGLIIDRTGKTAFTASDRFGDTGMDIYTFDVDEALKPEPVTYIRGKIVDKKTGMPVPARVKLLNLDKGKPVETLLDADNVGAFMVILPVGGRFAFHVGEEGYLFYSENFDVEATADNSPVFRTIELEPVEVGSTTNLYNIFFEIDAYAILPASEPELITLVKFLEQNPSLKIEIQGHTDNVGTETYNQELSGRRAASVAAFLEEHGINSARLSTKGYGFSVPIFSNETAEGRARNRRTTILITGTE
ncbi:MAG: OmpA family protein [Prolixibacteraceae bacterium]|nr:OmpA family protein [Prolixibacteraceae bacterium]